LQAQETSYNVPVMDPIEELLKEIAAFIEAQGMTESDFGRRALGDPSFVGDVKNNGRCPSLKTAKRVRDFMAEYVSVAEAGQ
jgi:hypothetical protein